MQTKPNAWNSGFLTSNVIFLNHHIEVNGTRLTRVGKNCPEQSVKFLGVIIDEFLYWKHHISNIKSKISRALFMLKQVKTFLPTDSLKTLYNSMIQPHFTYGLLAWRNTNECDMNKIILLQKGAIRYITKSHYNNRTEPLLQKCNILKFQDHFNIEVTLFICMTM